MPKPPPLDDDGMGSALPVVVGIVLIFCVLGFAGVFLHHGAGACDARSALPWRGCGR